MVEMHHGYLQGTYILRMSNLGLKILMLPSVRNGKVSSESYFVFVFCKVLFFTNDIERFFFVSAPPAPHEQTVQGQFLQEYNNSQISCKALALALMGWCPSPHLLLPLGVHACGRLIQKHHRWVSQDAQRKAQLE